MIVDATEIVRADAMDEPVHPDAKKYFVEAIKNFLETTNAAGLEVLASRLAPYTIQAAPPTMITDAPAQPVLILIVEESTQYPISAGELPDVVRLDSCPTGFPEAWDLQLCMDTSHESRVETIPSGDEFELIGDPVNNMDFSGSLSPYSQPPQDLLQSPVHLSDFSNTNHTDHHLAATSSPSRASIHDTYNTPSLFYNQHPSPLTEPDGASTVSPRSSEHSLAHPTSQGPTPHLPEILTGTPVQNAYIRADYAEYLISNLPRWQTSGIWHQETVVLPNQRHTKYDRLADAYSCICQLEPRMGDDPIRNRAALIQLHTEYENINQADECGDGPTRRGRGHASLIVDRLLDEIHPEWSTCDEQRRSNLRARFHNRKRFGKRWAVLTRHLGPAVLFLCSRKLEKMVYVFFFPVLLPETLADQQCRKNTVVTVQFLEQISEHIAGNCPDVVELLNTLNPLATDLIQNRDLNAHIINSTIDYLWKGHSEGLFDSGLTYLSPPV
ncbi:uncharacterized protein KD926_002573 [Aspergillus affinis]|uniref:uncharacterized protein n=1 Tax=Aspergillus affinis TaxID=1070780 RepID=UPI0022FF2A1B|nr:uncharacterized protein KD926_002573 [Aspergillus affinis]KAI9035961.1 hypothetical protein KD926_002573 [Aspergillus affinis]